MKLWRSTLTIAPLLVVIAACQASPVQPAAVVAGPVAQPAPGRTSFILSGFITDREGRPIANAEVRVPGKVVATGAAGYYSVDVLKGPTEVSVSKDGYEGDSRPVNVFSDARQDFVLSTMIRITAGDSATVTLSPNDPSYPFRDFYEECGSPCRIIRFAAPASLTGTVSITASARDKTLRLTAYYASGEGGLCCGSQFSLSQIVGPGGDIVLWVGFVELPGPDADLRIDFATSFRPQ